MIGWLLLLGAHHLDLRASTLEDPDWLVEQRVAEVKLIQGWLDQYFETKKNVFDMWKKCLVKEVALHGNMTTLCDHLVNLTMHSRRGFCIFNDFGNETYPFFLFFIINLLLIYYLYLLNNWKIYLIQINLLNW